METGHTFYVLSQTMGSVYRVLFGRPEEKRPLERPWRRWETNSVHLVLQKQIVHSATQEIPPLFIESECSSPRSQDAVLFKVLCNIS
jgi:hypothetical protein